MAKSLSENGKYNRIIALIDMDCFYCQVEEVLNPQLKGKPIVVQPLQYDDYGGGGIIALNYVAKARGVKREMRGDEAKKQCPDIELIRVPVVRGKADLSKYRNAGKQVAAVLQTFTALMARASVDEAYLDITSLVKRRLAEMNEGKFTLQPDALESTYVVGYENIGEYVQYITNKVTQHTEDEELDGFNLMESDRKDYKESNIKLLIASSIVNEIRATVKAKTGYECSAGIAHNKAMAKLVSGLNKPNKQTIMPADKVHELYSSLPVRKVQGLGGKLGDKVCEDLDIQFMGDLINFTKNDLMSKFNEKNGSWLFNIARGIDLEPITPHVVSKSIACCKKFPGRNALTTVGELKKWLHEIAGDMAKRIEDDQAENNRRPKQMTVNFMQFINNAEVSSSRTVNMTTYDEDSIVNNMLDILKKNTAKFLKSNGGDEMNNPIRFLGLTVGKFEDLNSKRGNSIQNLFIRTTKQLKKEVAGSSTSDLNSNENSDVDESVAEMGLDPVEPDDIEEPISNQAEEFQVERTVSPIPSTSMELKCPPEESVECEQCGKKIKKFDLQIHADAHLAFQMSQEQHLEFQNNLKRNIPTKGPPAKKSKSSHKDESDMSKISIAKYLVKQSESENTQIDGSSANLIATEKCGDCGKNIPIAELFEHMDFHAAKNLQMELSRAESNESKKGVCRVTEKKTKKKGIDSFFRK